MAFQAVRELLGKRYVKGEKHNDHGKEKNRKQKILRASYVFPKFRWIPQPYPLKIKFTKVPNYEMV